MDYFSQQDEAIYGLTTGLGDNCTKFIPEEDRIAIQRNNILAHTTSVGEPINGECTRAIMFVMLAHFGSGHTGIRLETLELLRDMLNKNVIPRVPGHDSIGYVTLEGHVGMVLIGEGEAWYNGMLLPGKEALHQASLEPTVLSSKEGLTVISGTTSVTTFSALALHDAVTLVRTCDISAALTAEVLKANLMSTDPRVMEARPHPDQGKTAHNLRTILRGSPILAAHAGHRLQDALSVRSVPQLHGAVKKFIKDGVDVLNIELNSSVDNPLLFEEDGVPVALMASNADGSYPGMVADVLSIAITDLAKNVTSSACQEDYSNMGYIAAKRLMTACIWPNTFLFINSLSMCGLFVPVLAGILYNGRKSKAAGIASMVAGTASWIYFTFFPVTCEVLGGTVDALLFFLPRVPDWKSFREGKVELFGTDGALMLLYCVLAVVYTYGILSHAGGLVGIFAPVFAFGITAFIFLRYCTEVFQFVKAAKKK